MVPRITFASVCAVISSAAGRTCDRSDGNTAMTEPLADHLDDVPTGSSPRWIRMRVTAASPPRGSSMATRVTLLSIQTEEIVTEAAPGPANAGNGPMTGRLTADSTTTETTPPTTTVTTMTGTGRTVRRPTAMRPTGQGSSSPSLKIAASAHGSRRACSSTQRQVLQGRVRGRPRRRHGRLPRWQHHPDRASC